MATSVKAQALTLLLAVGFASSAPVSAQSATDAFRTGETSRIGAPSARYAFATLGVTHLESHRWEHDRPRISQRLHRFGFNVQMPQNRGSLQYGTEVGFNLGYDNNHDIFVRLAGEGSTIRVRSDLWLADASLGVFFSVRPSSDFRLYLGGGPGVYWAQQGGGRGSRSEAGTSTGVSIRHDRRSGYNAWQLGSYMQAGLEVILSPRTTFGFNVRQNNVTLHFGNPGEANHSAIRMRSPQYAFTLGYHF